MHIYISQNFLTSIVSVHLWHKSTSKIFKLLYIFAGFGINSSVRISLAHVLHLYQDRFNSKSLKLVTDVHSKIASKAIQKMFLASCSRSPTVLSTSSWIRNVDSANFYPYWLKHSLPRPSFSFYDIFPTELIDTNNYYHFSTFNLHLHYVFYNGPSHEHYISWRRTSSEAVWLSVPFENLITCSHKSTSISIFFFCNVL